MGASIARNKAGLLDDCGARKLEVDHLPFYYHVVLNMPCNQRCIMCVPNFQHRKDVLPFEDFVAIFEQLRGVAEHITLIGGETLMYPQIEEVLELLAQQAIEVTTITNATMLTGNVVQRLLALHALDLRCSVDAATAATYREVRGTDTFERVAANLRSFAAAIRGRPHHRMVLNYVVMRRNLQDVVPFVAFARELDVALVAFQPVRHVASWQENNGTGWHFDGGEQSCETFRDEYNSVMRQAAAACEAAGVPYEVHIL